MNDKITLQEFVDLFARKCLISQAEAEVFVKEFLSLIEEALAKDKYVKVKGLGTFKLISVESRRSIDVNTGEEIEIKGHARISFIPETGLRDLINKPFAHFQSVPLKDNVHFSDLSEEEESSEEEEEEEKLDMEQPEESVEDISEKSLDAGVVSCAVDTRLKTEGNTEKTEKPAVTDIQDEVVRESLGSVKAVEREKMPVMAGQTKENGIPWCMIASMLLTGIFIGGIITWALTSGRRYIPEQVVEYLISQEQQKKVEQAVVSDSSRTIDTLVRVTPALPQTIQIQDTASMEKVVKVEETGHSVSVAKRETLADTVEYQIAGTQTSYTLRAGESLVRVAMKFYGNKKLWPYLVKHNKSIIKDPDNVAVGTTIQIPLLIPKK